MRSAQLRAAVAVAASVTALGLAVPASAATPTVSGIQHFLALQTKDPGSQQLFASGPIHAVGKDVQVNDTTDQFVFPTGAVTLTHTTTSHSQSFDPKLCLSQFHATGAYHLTSGTGAYAHVSGHGTYTINVYAVSCDPHKPATHFSSVIDAFGPASI